MKHAGTFATYQGIPCTAVRYRNARGARASVSEVEIPAPLLEADGGKQDQTQSGFRWSEWNAADLAAQARPQAPEGVDEAFAGAPRGALSLPQRLQWEGTLSLAEDPQRVLSIPGLAIVRVEKVDASANKAALAHFYRLTLVDWRFFLGRGAVTEWNFNVVRQDGTVRLDTTKAFPPGERYSLDEIAEVLRAGIWRHPEIARTPPAWDTNTREVTFLPFESMATALPKLCAYGEVVEPCLHIDGELAFYAPGEGKVGWAPEGKGENTEDLPDDHKAAEGLSWESAWPEEYVMVVGGPRVATVAVDDSEAVLMLDGVPALLTEQLVRNLTKNRYGLDWLAKIVVMPPSDHYVEGVPEATVKLLVEQAWTFYRVREAEKSEVGDYPDGSKGLRYTGEPGANAHLLPLLDRAGTAGGARRAVTVESYSWDVKKRRFRDATESGEQLASANQALAEIRQAVTRELLRRGSTRGNPLGQKNPPLATDGTVANLFRAEYRRGLPLDGMLGDVYLPDLDRAKVEAIMLELRRIALLEKVLPAEGARYRAEYTKKIEAESKRTDGTAKIAFELASTLIGYETKAAENSANQLSLNEDFVTSYRELSRVAAEKAARQMREARRTYAAKKEAGVAGGDFLERVHLRNKIRAVDAGARVVSRELGVVQLSARAGHVEKEDVSDPSRTRFIPRPVRIVFGAVTRPRLDAPRGGAPQRVPTQSAAPDKFGGRDFIPAVLSERESLYTATFRRVAQGKVEQVTGAPLDRVTVVRQPWQELIPLLSGAEAETGGQGPTGQEEQAQRDQAGAQDRVGESNRAELDEEARKIALQLSRRPDRVRAAPLELPGPWPVQCNGVVSAVEITMQKTGSAPCGFRTIVTIDGESTASGPAQTRERGRG